MMGIPNCVPEYYRSIQEDADHRWELEERRREHYRANQDKIEAAREAGLPLLDYGGYEACWECKDADHDTMTGEDDDICCVICHNANCPQHQKGRQTT